MKGHMTARQAATALGVSTMTITRLRDSGALAFSRVSERGYRYPAAEIRRLLAVHQEEPVWGARRLKVNPEPPAIRDLAVIEAPPVGLEELLQATLAGKSPNTLTTYRSSWRAFSLFLGVTDGETAFRKLLSLKQGEANLVGYKFLRSLYARGLAPASAALHLSAVRSVLKLARLCGLTALSLEVSAPWPEPLRDVRGPTGDEFRALLKALDTRATRHGREDRNRERDRAILLMLYSLGLRRAECLGLRLRDVDLVAGVVHVQGKGRRERVPLHVPLRARAALEEWLRVRGETDRDAPVFPVSGREVGYMLTRLSKLSGGRHVTPHQLRHSAITECLNLSNGDVRGVQKFSRHANVNHVIRYDDSRRDLAGEMADRLDAAQG